MKKFLTPLIMVSTFFFFTPAYAAVCVNNATYIGEVNYQTFAYNDGGVPSQATKSAAPFTPAQTCTLTSVGVRIAKESGRTAQDAYTLITNDASTTIATGSSINSIVSYTAGVAGWQWSTSTYSGANQVTLNAGTRYWIVTVASTTAAAGMVWSVGDTNSVAASFYSSAWQKANNPDNSAAYMIYGDFTTSEVTNALSVSNGTLQIDNGVVNLR